MIREENITIKVIMVGEETIMEGVNMDGEEIEIEVADSIRITDSIRLWMRSPGIQIWLYRKLQPKSIQRTLK